MKKALTLSSNFHVTTGEVVVTITSDEVIEAALKSSLLAYELIDSLTILDPHGVKVVIKQDVKSKNYTYNAASRKADRNFEFVLPSNQAEALTANLLRAYRDGANLGFNHFHLEGKAESSLFDLTIFFQLNA